MNIGQSKYQYDGDKQFVESFTNLELPGDQEMKQKRTSRSQARLLTEFKEKHIAKSSLKIEDGDEFTILLQATAQEHPLHKNKEDYFFKKTQKSQYASLLKKFENKSIKWIDESFPSREDLNLSPEIVWKNLQDLSDFTGKPSFIEKEITRDDIGQGANIGDCYMLSSLCALAEDHNRVLRLFPSLELNKNGIYMARLIFKGVLYEVVVDDRFPCIQDKDVWRLQGCKPALGYQIWPMILEKCWAKLWGSYKRTSSGYTSEVLHSLTGAATQTYFLNSQSNKKDELFKIMLEYYQRGYPMCTSTSIYNQQSIQGIFGRHAYSVLSVHNFINGKLVVVRNPWGCKQSHLKANDADADFWKLFTKEELEKTKLTFQEDGIFGILWEDFIKMYAEITVCKVKDNSNYLYLSLNGENNRYNFIDLHTEGGYHSICVSQKDRKDERLAADKYKQVTFIVSELKKTKSQGKAKQKYKYVSAKTISGYCDQYLQFQDLKAGNYRICIFLNNGEEQNQESVTFSVYSPSKFGIRDNHQVSSEQFLNKTFLSYAKDSKGKQKTGFYEEDDIWSINEFIPDCIFGAYVRHNGVNSKIKDLAQKVGYAQYLDNDIIVADCFRDKSIEISTKAGSQSLIVFHMKRMLTKNQNAPAIPCPIIKHIRL